MQLSIYVVFPLAPHGYINDIATITILSATLPMLMLQQTCNLYLWRSTTQHHYIHSNSITSTKTTTTTIAMATTPTTSATIFNIPQPPTSNTADNQVC